MSIALTFALALLDPLSPARKGLPGVIPLAVVDGRDFYAARALNELDRANRPFKVAELWSTRLTPDGDYRVAIRQVACAADWQVLYRWRVTPGYYWQTTGTAGTFSSIKRIPLDRLQDDYTPFLWNNSPLDEGSFTTDMRAARAAEDGISRGHPTADGYYDVLPIGADRAATVMAWKGELRVWRGQLPATSKRDSFGQPALEWEGCIRDAERHDLRQNPFDVNYRPLVVMKTAMRAQFRAFGGLDRAFLVTVPGQVHTCRPAAGEAATRALWDDARRPVIGVVSDAATNRTWAFTKAGPAAATVPAAPAVYFELAERLKPVPYDAAKVPAETRDDPLAAAVARARVLLADGKIALPK